MSSGRGWSKRWVPTRSSPGWAATNSGSCCRPGSDSDAALEAAAGRISRALAKPFALDELSLNVAASIGAARFPDDGSDANALLRCADVAMYAAKDAQAEYKLYAVEQNRHSVRRLSVLSDFRRALEDGDLEVHYQPIMALADRSIRGAEALVRWQHPERGLLTPGDFISTVEQTDLVGPLIRYVLERAVAACARWRRQGHQMSVAVNLSARNLLDRGLPDDVARMLNAAGVPSDALSLEITERMIMADPERAIANILRMSESRHAPVGRRLRDRLLLPGEPAAACRSTTSRSTARSCSRCCTPRAT